MQQRSFSGLFMPDNEDENLWQTVVKNITPLSPRKKRDAVSFIGKNKKTHKSDRRNPEKQLIHTTKQCVYPINQKENKGGIDRNTDKKLRRGQFPIEATLDLHGMRQHEAQPALKNFLTHCYAQKKRCVLVVTGKGYRSQHSSGILRRKLPHWIAEPSLASFILNVYPAQPKDGGEGAFYILLKRHRQKS